MKYTYLMSISVLFSWTVFSQQVPTGNPVPGSYTTAQQAASAWYRGGNNSGNTGGTNNIFGTSASWNSPIYTQTNGLLRMKLNGIVNYTINGVLPPASPGRDGFMLLGLNNNNVNGTNIYSALGAYSLLHLNGQGNVVQELGHRIWMRTGITLTGNDDLSYFGLRTIGVLAPGSLGNDQTETVIAWSDNGAVNNIGADEMAFRFMGQNASSAAATESTDFASTNDLDGLHVARFTPAGRFGLGNTFGYISSAGGMASATTVSTPQSLMHLSYQFLAGTQFEPFGFQQITYRRPLNAAADIIGQGEMTTDGLRFGIDNDILGPPGFRHLNSYLRWQEASSFVIQTEDNNTPSIQDNERMRITSIGAINLNNNFALYYGLNSAGGANNDNITRVSISQNGSTALALTRPKSLLHIGYDYGNFLVGPGIQGYRKWMDLGMLTSNNMDHVWIGLKPRLPQNTQVVQAVTSLDNQLDAVVAWGTDRVAADSAQVDNMRFIFTGHPFDANPEIAPSVTEDGLEMMRLYPASFYSHYEYDSNGNISDTTLSYGRLGVGDFTAAGVNQPPTHKLDVIGNGRFRYLPDSTFIADSLTQKYVMVDEDGVLRWTEKPSGNGFGAECSDTVGGKLQFDTKVDLNNYNLYFTNNDSLGANHVGIGVNCGNVLEGKLTVLQTHLDSVNQNTTAIVGINNDLSNGPFATFIGGDFRAIGQQNLNNFSMNFGTSVLAEGASFNVGTYSYANSVANPNSSNMAGIFRTGGTTFNSTAGQFNAQGGTNENYGVYTNASGGTNAYGVFTSASGASVDNWALYVDGDANCTGSAFGFSDSTLKQNIIDDQGALSKLMRLRPVNYDMRQSEFPYVNLASGLQHGFISQEVEAVFPELVRDVTHPAKYDDLGNEISPELTVKGLNYNGIISLNTQAIKELNMSIRSNTLSDETIKVNVEDLSGSLAKVLDMRGVTYDWNPGAMDSLNLDTCTHIGFIAQEINAIDPLLTFMDDHNLMNVDYSKVVPVAVEAIQELNTKVDEQQEVIEEQQEMLAEQATTISDLNDRLSDLENCLSGILPYLCQLNNSAIQQTEEVMQEQLKAIIDVQLSDKNSIVLNQNVPNPFAESTVITYSVPAAVQRAQIHFYDMNGILINSVDISERGEGQINVYANDLSSGIYTYSLVADGKVVSTKKMMKN